MMKNKMVIFGVGAVLVSVLIAAGDAKRVVSADKKPPGDEGKTGSSAPAQMADNPSTHIVPCWSVNGAGIVRATSDSFRIGLSGGQAVSGEAAGPNYRMGIGFWYGFCFCGNCWPDVNGDCFINPADVVIMVQYVYKGIDLRVYPPGWYCPRDLGDWNCDGFKNPADVVVYVQYVYKSINLFCPDPCGP